MRPPCSTASLDRGLTRPTEVSSLSMVSFRGWSAGSPISLRTLPRLLASLSGDTGFSR